MRRLEHGHFVPEVCTRCDAEAPDQASADVAQDVAVEIGKDEHVVLLRAGHQLHRAVVDNSILELDIRVLLGHRARGGEEQPVGELHDVGFVDRRYLVPAIPTGIFEGEANDPTAAGDGDRLDGDP